MPEIPAITLTFRLSANEIIANALVIAFLAIEPVRSRTGGDWFADRTVRLISTCVYCGTRLACSTGMLSDSDASAWLTSWRAAANPPRRASSGLGEAT